MEEVVDEATVDEAEVDNFTEHFDLVFTATIEVIPGETEEGEPA